MKVNFSSSSLIVLGTPCLSRGTSETAQQLATKSGRVQSGIMLPKPKNCIGASRVKRKKTTKCNTGAKAVAQRSQKSVSYKIPRFFL